ncbi:precorrin-3B synthase [Paraburkholderia sp. MMS20-SJTR3]|uniref:Precorrin-3B synthase n=1 Tax=Paraburkholderia sejongensis TaxID=2886946 RepID=A0ABS8JZA1_9BURK|nr:precorrin-3B synthase [Paraburkholderia sp. MMS20-SJTR3]MCC8395237.1 precorrin-3B synthase [Paraburkholderia sp. MMS20-SJTR3]
MPTSRDAKPGVLLNRASPSTVLPHALTASRPSACPGLVRIVAARDGGICRIKLPGGELAAAQARAIADLSTKHAHGVIELTNRGNLQLRGVRAGHEATLSAALLRAGLGPGPAAGWAESADSAGSAQATESGESVESAGSMESMEPAESSACFAANDAGTPNTAALSCADDVRNLMISPVAGRDPYALIDTAPLGAELLALLQSDARFVALSPKFALLLDGGERLARLDHPHDVWLAASSDADGVRFVFGLAGCPQPAGTGAGTAALAAVLPSRVPALVRALLHTFLDLAPASATRMRDLLALHCADALLQHAQRYVDFPLARDAALSHWQRPRAADAARRLGAHAQRDAGLWHVGGQPPLGRLDAATLRALATLAQRHGNARLHATPWQSVLLPDIPTDAVPAVLAKLIALGLACDPAEPIAHVIACAGSSGCAKGLADTKSDALQLAAQLPAGIDAHLSGCPRSCAAAHCAPYTLLASAPGRYDLYQRDGGPGFGRCVANQQTIDEAAALLARLARSNPNA